MSTFNVGDKVLCVGRNFDGVRLPSYGKKGHITSVTKLGYRVLFEDKTQNTLFLADLVSFVEKVEPKYRTVLSNTVQGLSADVNKLIQDGWWPTGGIATVQVTRNEECYVQAMVKE